MPIWDEVFKKEKPQKPQKRVVNIDKAPARKKFVQEGILDYLDRSRELQQLDDRMRYPIDKDK